MLFWSFQIQVSGIDLTLRSKMDVCVFLYPLRVFVEFTT